MEHDDRAAQRYWIMQAARLSGVALVLAGAMVLAGQIDWPEAAGAALLLAGAVAFFMVPYLLAKRWKSPGG